MSEQLHPPGEQLALDAPAPGELAAGRAPAPGSVEPSAARVRTLAGTLAGYRWPGRGGLDKLRAPQRTAAEAAAYNALKALAQAPD